MSEDKGSSMTKKIHVEESLFVYIHHVASTCIYKVDQKSVSGCKKTLETRLVDYVSGTLFKELVRAEPVNKSAFRRVSGCTGSDGE